MASSQFEQLEQLPGDHRSSFGVAALDGRIYVAGGHSSKFHFYPPNGFSADAHVYDIAVGRWEKIHPMPVATQGLRLIPYGQYIYAFGGFVYERATHTHRAYSPQHPGDIQWAARSSDTVFRYSIDTDRWEYVISMPRRRSSNIACLIDNRVYLVGGWDGTPQKVGDSAGRFHMTTESFDLETHQFSPSTMYISDSGGPPRRAFTSLTDGERIIVAGGIRQSTPDDGGADIGLNLVQEFIPTKNSWRTLAPLPETLFSPGIGLLGTRIFLAGGHHFPRHADSDSIYELVNENWVEVAKLPTPSTFVELVPLAEGTIGILGGHGPKYPLNTFYSFTP